MFTRLEIFFFKQKTAYEMRISDWSSDVCSSDLRQRGGGTGDHRLIGHRLRLLHLSRTYDHRGAGAAARDSGRAADTRRAADDGDDPVDRKSVVYGKSVSVRVDLGGRSIIQKKKHSDMQ